MPIHYGRDPRFVPDSPLRAPGGNGRILYEVRPGVTARPSEPIKENNPMSETKTELTDELAQETYDGLYIGNSLSVNRCAELLDVAPAQLKSVWDGMKLRLRNRKEAARASKQSGQPWEWGEAEASPAADDTPLAEALGIAIPDSGGETYANGNLEPVTDGGRGRRAVPVDALAAAAAVETGQPVAFQIRDGEVVGEQPTPTVTGLQKFAAALDSSTISMILTDLRAEADPDINHIRHYLAVEFRRLLNTRK